VTIKILRPKLSGSDERLILLSVLSLAFVIRVAWILLVPSTPLADFAEYDRLGWGLATQGVYATALGEPTAYRPPGYPLLLALLYRMVGHQSLIARLLNAGLGTLTCLLLFRLTVRIGLRGLALPVTVFYALYPTAIYYTNLLATEVLFTFLLLAIILIWLDLTEYHPPSRRTSFCRVILALCLGGLSGIAVLVRPVLLPILGLFLTFRVRRLRLVRQTWYFLLLSILALLLVILPWTYRNYQLSGRLVLISTNGGVNFFIGNNPSATGEYFVPVDNPLEGLTEWEMDQVGWKAGTEFIRKHPLLFLRNYPIKAADLFSLEWDGFFWNFQTLETFAQQVHSLQIVKESAALVPFFLLPLGASAGLMVLGMWGLKQVYALPQRSLLVTLIGAWIVVHAIFFVNSRFHFSLVPLLTISAIHLIHGWLRHEGCSGSGLLYWLRHVSPGDYGISLYMVAVMISWGKVVIARLTAYYL
jgi:4-amino-4-deoxy-L-arabinose transferase-like glycosyltransferase